MDSPTHPILQEICHLDTSSPGFPHRLSYVLYGQKYNQCVSSLGDDDLTWLINYLDEVCQRIAFLHALLNWHRC